MKVLFLLLISSVCFADAAHWQAGSKITNPCIWPEAPITSITGATTGTVKVELVPLVAGKKIYVCSLTVIGVSGSATPTFSLVEGTGTACGTSTGTKVQSFGVGTSMWNFTHPVTAGTSGYALCYLQTGTSPVANYQINYVQM